MLDKKAQTMYERTLLDKRILRANGEEQNVTISANKGGGCRNGHPPILAVANNLLIQTGNREEQRRKCEQSNSLEMPDFTGFSALRRSAGSSEENGKNDLLSDRPRVRIAPGSPLQTLDGLIIF